MSFKEKFNDVKQKAKEKTGKAKTSVKKFWDEYGGYVIGGATIAGAVVAAVAVNNSVENSMKNVVEYSDENYKSKQIPVGNGLYMTANAKTDVIGLKQAWEEGRGKEDYEKVKAVADTLDMRENDLYVIETRKKEDGELEIGVSQLIDWNYRLDQIK